MAAAVLVREAREDDVAAIREIFTATYEGDYPHRSFFDDRWLKRSVFVDDILMLVAEDHDAGRVIGTASVVFDIGAHSDLIGELGRLAVHPEERSRGIGSLLMEKRIEYIQNRLHVGVVRNRTCHAHSQRIAEAHGFAPVGFLPLRSRFRVRESTALYARHFGVALRLRCNNPRIVPEAHALASQALEACGLPDDVIVDEEASSYPRDADLLLEELTADGLPSLLRIERGRVRRRQVFGPARLQYGFFMLEARHATYLIAREPRGTRASGAMAGAIGYIREDLEHTVRVFELIAGTDAVARALFEALLDRCRSDWGTEYVEVDVSTRSAGLQRTLLELGFLPAAYVPAMVFADVERLDVVRMVRLMVPPRLVDLRLTPAMQAIADTVMRGFDRQAVLPAIAEAVGRLSAFEGLNPEQARRLASACAVIELAEGEELFAEGSAPERLFVLIEGEATVVQGAPPRRIGRVRAGDCLGELAALTGEAHSAGARAATPVVAAVLDRGQLRTLTRSRPDVGLVLYRNLAVSLGRKLRQVDRRLGRPRAARRA